jgi:hypothetical protein
MSEAKVAQLPGRRAAPTKPRKRKASRESWTAEKKATFLATLAATCNVSAAIRASAMSESSMYRLRTRSEEFRDQWEAALREGYARLELMLLERAMKGTAKPVFHGGAKVGEITEYSDRLSLTLLSVHRAAGVGPVARAAAVDPAELRQRIRDKLDEMNSRLAADD